mgnify:FL=1
MATAFQIVFRGKVQEMYYSDGTLAARYIRVPNLVRRHVADMGAARQSRKFGGYANSDMFPSMIRRAAEAAGCRDYGSYKGSRGLCVDLHKPLPDSIRVDESGFLATVTIDVPDAA